MLLNGIINGNGTSSRIRQISIIRFLNNVDADVTQLQTTIKINTINRFVFIFHACWLFTVDDILYIDIHVFKWLLRIDVPLFPLLTDSNSIWFFSSILHIHWIIVRFNWITFTFDIENWRVQKKTTEIFDKKKAYMWPKLAYVST